ncbi:MAG: hypothetical protein PHY30_01465 [Candidatus Pacebacteria bacterium]|nr:hypothetical protein [Candidatus Paceibacterota bacterium]
MKNIYNYILNLIFPKKCINCGKEGSHFCEDCLSLIELNKINYCACANNPRKNCSRCENCPSNIFAVFTVFNEKQKLVQKLLFKSKTIPDLNLYFSYLIITYIKIMTNLNLNENFSIFYKDKEVKNIAKMLSKFTKLKISDQKENILFLTKKYPCESVDLKNKKVYIISLFREIL